jgi:hypothetical protein
MRWLACVLLLVPGPLRAEPGPAKAPPAVVLRDGRLSARLEAAEVREVLADLAKQAGAEVQGTVPEGRLVSTTFEGLSLQAALERVLGDVSFALVYGPDGKVRTIELRGGPQAPSARAVPSPPDEVLGLQGWPPSDMVREAAERLQGFMLSDQSIPVEGRLARTLGADATSFRTLAQTSVEHDDARVRAQALRTALRALEEDREMREALAATLDSVGDAFLTQYVRNIAKDRAGEFASRLARSAKTDALRTRAQAVASRVDDGPPSR